MTLLQIDIYEIPTNADEWGKLFYSFPIHIRILIGVILIFCMIITILFAIILTSRIFKTNRSLIAHRLRRKYQSVFTQLLFEDDTRLLSDTLFSLFDKKDLTRRFNRSVLLEELIHLHENFTGETALRLELLYRKLNFQHDSLRKLRSRRWYVVAKGLRELALMNIHESKAPLLKFISSKNDVLRMEARIALVKLSETDPLAFLSKETEIMSAWDMANIHAMLSKIPEEKVPDFSIWLNSPNRSVVLFSISMIGAFKQNDAIPVLLRLLDEKNEPVKLASIKALREMNAHQAEEKLITMFPLESPAVQGEILKSLETLASEKSISLLEIILRQPVPDMSHAIYCVKALLGLGDPGKRALANIQVNNSNRLQLIIHHASDPRI